MPNKYKASVPKIAIQIAKKTSLSKRCNCKTKSAFDKNLNAKANSKNPKDYKIVGEVLSTEPIAIMVRKDDPEFKAAVNAAIAKIVANGNMPKLWDKWFLKPIPPKNIVVGLELSPATKNAWANLNDKPAEDYQQKK